MVVPECFAFTLENMPVTPEDTSRIKRRCLVKEWQREIQEIISLRPLTPAPPKAA